MWIVLNDGFLSIVDKSKIPGHLMVRARVKAHILSVFPDAKVRATPGVDYQFRADIGRREVAVVIANRITGIDYDNFKDSVKDKRLHDACSRTWSVMFSLVEPGNTHTRGRGRQVPQRELFGDGYWNRY